MACLVLLIQTGAKSADKVPKSDRNGDNVADFVEKFGISNFGRHELTSS